MNIEKHLGDLYDMISDEESIPSYDPDEFAEIAQRIIDEEPVYIRFAFQPGANRVLTTDPDNPEREMYAELVYRDTHRCQIPLTLGVDATH
jgi:hypothetical protein